MAHYQGRPTWRCLACQKHPIPLTVCDHCGDHHGFVFIVGFRHRFNQKHCLDLLHPIACCLEKIELGDVRAVVLVLFCFVGGTAVAD